MSDFSLDQMYADLKTADEAGNTDLARTIADRISETQATQTKPLKIGREGLPDAVKAIAGDFNPLSQLAVGVKSALDNAAMRGKQLVGGTLTPEQEMEARANRALLEESPMATTGNIGGTLVATGNPVGALYRGGTALAAKLVPQWLAKSGAAATIGAVAPNVLEPVLEGESSADKAKAGALGATVLDAALRGGGRVVQPILQSPAVKKLLEAKVVPTMGQAADEASVMGRMVKGVEEKLQSVPIIGDVIKNARRRAVEEFNLAALRQASPGVTKIGREGVQQAEEQIGQKYDDALSMFTNGVAPDLAFVTKAQDITKNSGLLLGRDQIRQFNAFLKDKITDVSAKNGGTLPAELAKKIDSEIGGKARELASSSIQSERDLGKAFGSLQREMRDLFTRSAPTPEANALLNEANGQWAQFVRVQKAAGSLGAKDGIFTPAQYQAAVKSSDTSVRKGRFAKGQALGQDLSDAGKSVLGDTVPNSGSIDRLLVAQALLGAGGAGAAAYGHERVGGGAIAAALAAPLLYSRPSQRYMLGNLIPGQQTLANLIRQAAQEGSVAGGILNTQGPLQGIIKSQ
jgi:hypothetical protein